MRWLSLLLLSMFCFSCASDVDGRKGRLRIGVDPSWAPLNFEELQPYVTGYTEDCLLEIARYSGLEFEKVNANWDSLLDGMRTGAYDAVITSLPPYEFNVAKYDFSADLIQLGPVLITETASKQMKLDDLSHELVGVIKNDPAMLAVERYPLVIIRSYNTIPELLDAVASGELAAAVLDRLWAASFVNDLYNGKLKIASEPMSDLGLHLIAPKGKYERLIRSFDKSIKQLKKKKFPELQKKWNLTG